MNRLRFLGASIVTALLATSVQALEFGKPIVTTLATNSTKVSDSKKEIVLMNIMLTPREQAAFYSYQPKKMNMVQAMRSTLPPAVDLGMNNTPVLDQGRHGACVTFANTAAIDAIIGKGDYISQLCQLELGSYLQEKGYMSSGWNGSLGPWVLDQMMRFGIVNKENQKTKSCADVTEYPLLDYANEGKPISVKEYKRLSEDIQSKFYVNNLMNAIQRFDTKFSDRDQAEDVLINVKKALIKGNRLTFASFVVLTPYCSIGACASYHTAADTWALTKEIELPPYFSAGHEMVIIGYDDRAVAIDQEGTKHQGLLKLRNSWGEEAGDHGNYYMTYDYFKKFVVEVQEIAEIKN